MSVHGLVIPIWVSLTTVLLPVSLGYVDPSSLDFSLVKVSVAGSFFRGRGANPAHNPPFFTSGLGTGKDRVSVERHKLIVLKSLKF